MTNTAVAKSPSYHGLKPHGTEARYKQGQGCRCEPCVLAHRAYQKSLADRNRAKGLTSVGKPYSPRVVKLARHGTVERYHQRCTCHECKRAYNIYRRVRYHYPSAIDSVKNLTDIQHPGFVRLMRDIVGPDDELSVAIMEKVRSRVRARLKREFYGLPDGPSTTIAEEIDSMSWDQIRWLMQSEIPSLAQTRKRHRSMDQL